jgi:hypothetical protein
MAWAGFRPLGHVREPADGENGGEAGHETLTIEDGVTAVHAHRILKFLLPVSAVCIL